MVCRAGLATPTVKMPAESFVADANSKACMLFTDTGSSEYPGKAMLRPTERLWWEPHRFVLGVTGATIIGFLAGTMMVCLKLSPPDRQGDQYTVSFGIGVAIVTLAALAGYGFGSLLLGRYAAGVYNACSARSSSPSLS